jgi:hypothetical protein
MGDNIFGMDIRRFSVLFIAIIIILSFLASFTNIKVPQNGGIQIGSGGGSEGSYSVPGPKYIYNKTITLSPSIQDLEYVKGSYSNLPAPYYNISKCVYILFNFSKPCSNMLHLLLNALAWNASMIAPGPYGALLSIASSAYVHIINYRNTTVQPFPLNQNDTENYSKWEIIVKYGKCFELPTGFQPDWSYPPSDQVSVGSPSCEIIATCSVATSVNVVYTSCTYEVCSHSHSYKEGNTTICCICNYFAMSVHGTAYLYAKGKQIASQSFSHVFYWYGGSYSSRICGTVTVQPGVSKQVYAYYTVSAGSGHSSYREKNGNTIIIVHNYYPTGPFVNKQCYIFNWYEYKVTVKVHIIVNNGTNPMTQIGDKTYSGRNITACLTYCTWSSDPQPKSIDITTHDSIQVAGYSIGRTWDAGSVTINPCCCTQQDGNVINYYLKFNIQCFLEQSPCWIDQPMTYNERATLDWYYLEQNVSLAYALYNYIMSTINKSDLQYWKFEYFVLASQFVMYSYNTTYSVFNNLLELESFYENWSLVNANILNLSVWPKLQYFNYQIMFFNVSRIPQIYNNTIFMNITGNYEIYLVDVYNALGYSQFNKVPFGNEYYFYDPETNQTFYFYLNTTGRPLPYIGQTLYFTSANYIPNIFYAIFQYPPETPEKVIAIWNGTAWVT